MLEHALCQPPHEFHTPKRPPKKVTYLPSHWHVTGFNFRHYRTRIKVDTPISDNLSNLPSMWYTCDNGVIFDTPGNRYHDVNFFWSNEITVDFQKQDPLPTHIHSTSWSFSISGKQKPEYIRCAFQATQIRAFLTYFFGRWISLTVRTPLSHRHYLFPTS